MKVVLNKKKGLRGQKYKKGQVADIPYKVARRWIDRGVASTYDSSKQALLKRPYNRFKKQKFDVRVYDNEPISIIILALYNLDYLKDCIESIKEYTRDYELIIIGNGPDDDVKNYILNLKNAKVLINDENMGVSYGWNQGIKLATKEYVCFLNDDTIVTPGWAHKLQKCFKLHKDCGLASPSTSYATGPTQCSADVMNRRFEMTVEDMLKYADSLEDGYNIQTIVGFCMLTTKKLLNKIGAFDHKRYKIGNYEETDWQYRMEQLGYNSYWVKGAYVHHFGHASFQKMDVDFGQLVRDNLRSFQERKKDKNLFIKNDAKIGKVIENKSTKKDTQIIYVLKDSGISGGHRVVFEHLKGLSQRGYECELCYLSGDPHWFNDINFKLSKFKNEEQLIRYMGYSNAVKVATWWETANWVYQAGGGYYHVQDIETSYYDDKGMKDKVLESYKLGLHHTTTNSFQEVALKYAIGAKVDRVGIAIDHSYFKPKKVANRPNSGFYFYRDNHFKRPSLLKEALKYIPELNLYAFGQSKCPFAKETFNNLDDTQIAELFSSIDVYISTSTHEGFCLPILEAMACGTPVVTTKANGNETFCADELNCLIAETPKEIAGAVKRILTDKRLAKRLSKNGLITAKGFTWDKVIDRLEKIYKEDIC